jgi:hypothetical protein
VFVSAVLVWGQNPKLSIIEQASGSDHSGKNRQRWSGEIWGYRLKGCEVNQL